MLTRPAYRSDAAAAIAASRPGRPAGLEQAVRTRLPHRTGALIAVCPEENVLVYTLGGHDDAARLHAAAAEMVPQARLPLSTEVMEWSNGAWRPAR